MPINHNAPPPYPPGFRGQAEPLTRGAIDIAIDKVGVSEAAFWAVLKVETQGYGFLPDRRPVILFERHIFSRLTSGIYDERWRAISSITPGGYGAGGAAQYDRLALALDADRLGHGEHALQACSWGLPQIMGMNHARAGFRNVGDMVAAFCMGEDNHVAALATFVLGDEVLARSLRNLNWRAFARRYNGPAQKGYDARLEAAYTNFVHHGPPDLRVRAAQIFLLRMGLYRGHIDGIDGPKTRAALAAAGITGLSHDAHRILRARSLVSKPAKPQEQA